MHLKPSLPIVLVTGGSAGIGGSVAQALARHGFEVWFVGRNAVRGRDQEDRIRSAGGLARFFAADLSSQSAIANFAATVLAALEGRGLTGLVNNLGGVFPEKGLTADGVERTYAYNFVHPLLLAALLLPALEKAGGRVIQMSTGYHHLVRLTPADLAGRRWDCAMNVYGRSKLLSVQVGELVGRAWAKRGVGLHFADPGMAETPLTKSMRHKDFPWYGRFMSPLVHRLQPLMKLEWCASSTVRLLTRRHLSAPSGVYVLPGPHELSHALVGYDLRRARELWPVVLEWFAPPWRIVVSVSVSLTESRPEPVLP